MARGLSEHERNRLVRELAAASKRGRERQQRVLREAEKRLRKSRVKNPQAVVLSQWAIAKERRKIIEAGKLRGHPGRRRAGLLAPLKPSGLIRGAALPKGVEPKDIGASEAQQRAWEKEQKAKAEAKTKAEKLEKEREALQRIQEAQKKKEEAARKAKVAAEMKIAQEKLLKIQAEQRKKLETQKAKLAVEKKAAEEAKRKVEEIQRKQIEEKKKVRVEKEPIGVIRAIPKEKGLARIQQRITKAKATQLTKIGRVAPSAKGTLERIVRGTFILGALGVIRGGVGVAEAIRHPIRTTKSLYQMVRHPVLTITALGKEFRVDPVGMIAEFATFSKGLGLIGKSIKRSPVGRTIQEELFIRSQPKELQRPVRAIIKGAKAQEALNPFKVKSVKNVDFMEVRSLTRTEAKVIDKTLRETDSVLFGSTAARTLSKKKTPIPKDVDLATKSVREFNTKFMNNLPKNIRKNYMVKGQKIIRKSNNERLMDVKPLSRLIQQRSIITKRGYIPVSGYVRKIIRRKGEIIPRIRKKVRVGALEIPTKKLVKIKKIKLVGFGEQTTRKGLGTLQVLIEKNVRRAKDPQAFVKSLQVQLESLKRAKPKTPIGRFRNKRKIRTLQNSLKILTSKQFSRLLEKKVPELTQRYPILKKINVRRLKGVKRLSQEKVKRIVRKVEIKKRVIRRVPKRKPSITKIRREIIKLKRMKPKTRKGKIRRLKAIKKRRKLLKKIRRKPSKLPRRRRIRRVPSKLPRRRKPSKLPPSKVPRRRPSRIPPSKVPKRKPSKIPPSRIPKRRVPPSRVPPSRVPKTRIPPSKVPPTRVPPTRVPPTRVPPTRVPPTRVPPTRVPPTRVPPTRRPPPRKPPPIRPPRKKKKKMRAFDVLAKKHGRKTRYIRINKGALSRTNAIRLGRYVVNHSPLASFKIRPTIRKATQKFGKRTSGKLFRPRKGKTKLPTRVRVEKRRYRINTEGEKVGITLKGINKRRTQTGVLAFIRKQIARKKRRMKQNAKTKKRKRIFKKSKRKKSSGKSKRT